MPFLGSQPADQYQSLAKQTITGDGSTAYTLTRSVTNAYDMEVFINNVRQEPDTSYTASGNTITFTAAVTASDSCYLIYQGQSVGSINPPANSVGTSQVASNSITTAHMHTGFTLPAQTGALDITTNTHANASVFKSTGHTQIMLQDTDATANDQFWGLQNSGGSFNIVTCNDDRASGFVTPVEITQAGYVTHSKLPSFHAQHTSAPSTSEITSWTVRYNNGNHFNASNGRFTAPVTGTYYFNFFGMTAGAGTFDVSLWTNGADDNQMVPYQSATGGTHVSSSGGIVKRLDVGDYVSLRNNNVALYATSNGRHGGFCGFLIG